ncbi:MAG: hypothetical protein HQ525_04760, partial [Anaerolineae bacterium]|nr:hypothetical protein [Anaerolineae bacterium]
MLLNNHQDFAKLDPQNMLTEIDGLPDQLATAWSLGQKQDLPDLSHIRQIVIAG